MIKRILKYLFLRRRWRKINFHNRTIIGNGVNINLTKVGKQSYGKVHAYEFNDINKLTIGNFCSVAPNVNFIVSADHYVNHVSTFPFKSKIIDGKNEGVSKGDIIIEDDVWIGHGATILSGVHIHQGAVIAAGAVITNDVPPYAIVGGVPGKIIKYRFNDNIIRYMTTLDYSLLSEEIIREHINDLYLDISEMQIDEIEHLFKWFPKKSNNKCSN